MRRALADAHGSIAVQINLQTPEEVDAAIARAQARRRHRDHAGDGHVLGHALRPAARPLRLRVGVRRAAPALDHAKEIRSRERLRSDRHRHRPRRLRLRHPRRQLGLKVAVVEKRATHGGTCLNVGCIPSKALLHASELYEEAGHAFAAMGIEVAPKLDLAQMLAFKDEGVKGNVDGVAFLLKKNKIDHFHGTGRDRSAPARSR